MNSEYKILASGSSGNAIILRNYILLDCGIAYIQLKPYIKQLKLVFISHIHSLCRPLKQKLCEKNSF